jgi:hypothetical protein
MVMSKITIGNGCTIGNIGDGATNNNFTFNGNRQETLNNDLLYNELVNLVNHMQTLPKNGEQQQEFEKIKEAAHAAKSGEHTTLKKSLLYLGNWTLEIAKALTLKIIPELIQHHS